MAGIMQRLKLDLEYLLILALAVDTEKKSVFGYGTRHPYPDRVRLLERVQYLYITDGLYGWMELLGLSSESAK